MSENVSNTRSTEAERGSSTPVFEPGSDLFIAQFDRPPNLLPVNMRALSPFQRALLVIDGTVTVFLEAFTLEPIDVIKRGQSLQALLEDSPWLALDAGARVVARQVTLQGRYSGRVYAFADSLIALDRLPPELVAELDAAGGGLGRILNSAQSENRREILWFGRERSASSSVDRGLMPTGDLIVRTYRIIQGGKPIMLISERFPATELGQPAHD